MLTSLDHKLCQALCDLPRKHQNRYTLEAENELRDNLFRSLSNDRADYLRWLFPGGFPSSYKLQEAQCSQEDAEYTAAAKGSPCGHIFQPGEASYHCMTCADDATCVLCARCFDSSDHEGHQFHITPSAGNSGCCDCGDEEAWKRPVNCAIHTATYKAEAEGQSTSSLPADFQESIRTTISRVLDYFCDVISCSPENLRVPKTVETIRHDENYSRLGAKYYSSSLDLEEDPEYAMILWNDEKHTVNEVKEQVARACRMRLSFGTKKAHEADQYGRTVVSHSRDVEKLIKQAKIIEQIKLTVTIRSSRDTFREQMCGTIIDWLSDIAGCSAGDDHSIMRNTICEEMLQQWRIGSEAYNAKVGRSGIDTHGLEPPRNFHRHLHWPQRIQEGINLGILDDDDDNEGEDMIDLEGDQEDLGDVDDDDDEDDEMDETGGFEREQVIWPDGTPVRTDHLAEMTAPEVIEALIRPTEATGANGFIDVSEYVVVDEPLPPPPPPQQLAPAEVQDVIMESSANEVSDAEVSEDQTRNYLNVPKTPGQDTRGTQTVLPNHWAVLPVELSMYSRDVPAYEDLSRNIRLDSMILFDLRLWKQARVQLRDLYISTVVKVPQFKRIIGLRFAGLYTTLSQLYLVADREPDHSIMNLSLQMLTTPSITKEVIERGNFLTNLMAILYTFLTTRQVGFPVDVDNNATLAFETGTVANRRLIHFFTDLRWYLASSFVQERVRKDKQYLLQYLDLAKLSQGICPNVRAVGEHVEYETDAWINASVLTREINKLCRQFAEAFHHSRGKENTDCTIDAIFQTACVAITNSIGLERKRFNQSEIKALAKFKNLPPYGLEGAGTAPHRVIEFVVERGALSFHHALHYTLSWLLEFGNSSTQAIEALLEAARQTVRGLSDSRLKNTFPAREDALLSMFDYPLRVCAWLAQMKAGMWVRNGLSLRHQMYQYKNVAYRDVGHHRDLVLLQTALVACDPTRVLASMIDRFGLDQWMRGNYQSAVDCDSGQMLEISEEFIFMLINLLSDRDALVPLEEEPNQQILAIRKDIIHTLCFKPLTFSDLTARLTERIQDQQQFQDVLDSLTTYRAPEGLHDSGSFELRPEFLSELDPYNTHFNKNQRDEAESIYKAWMSKKVNKAAEDVVLEPVLRPIREGAYTQLCAVTGKKIFAQVIHACLEYARTAKISASEVAATRVEAFLQVVLHLVMISTLEDNSSDELHSVGLSNSFIRNCLVLAHDSSSKTVVATLHDLANVDEFASCRSKIKHILKMFLRKREREFHQAAAGLASPFGRLDTASPANIESENEAKKKQALNRKAKILAQFQQQQQSFMDRQGMADWEDDDMSEAEPDMPTSTDVRVWRMPTGVCIHCREETNDSQLYGTFAMITESRTLRQTNLDDPEFIHECLDTPSSLDHASDLDRPFGVSGWNLEKIPRMTSDGQEVYVERQGLGKGWPPGFTLDGLVSTGCGHIMHFGCFQNYYHSVARRQSHQIARNHPERLARKEFVCPLCKALGNAFLPITRNSVEQSMHVNGPEKSLEGFLGGELQNKLDGMRELMADVRSYTNAGNETIDTELQAAKVRLTDTFQAIMSDALLPIKNPCELHLHLGVLAASITVTEIAHRGHDAEFGLTYLSRVPQQSLTHLRILASSLEKVPTHASLVGKHDDNLTHAPPSLRDALPDRSWETWHVASLCTLKLFPKIAVSSPISKELESYSRPLLLSDPFGTLVNASLTLCKMADIDLDHVLRLCYAAEIFRVIVAYMLNPKGLLKCLQENPGLVENRNPVPGQISDPDLRSITGTIQWIHGQLQQLKHYTSPLDLSGFTISGPVAAAISQLVHTQALVFARKSALLLHVAHGLDFPFDGGSEAASPELDRLTKLIGLPDICALLDHISEFSVNGLMKSLASDWLQEMMEFRYEAALGNHAEWPEGVPEIKLLHPAPLELIGLPKHFDVLMEEAHRRRCPTTGKESTDPALCLFCGEIFCAQAICCMKDDPRGGCNKHLEKCSYPIGLFLFIRKCQVLLLHVAAIPSTVRDGAGSSVARWKSNGSFFPAPYLTKHGETDSGLRSKYQLILNQKRYDKLLRDAWLMVSAGSTIWSAIARKLEGEVNAGGWETL